MGALYRFARLAVERQDGIVDKFAGDAVMATFNVAGARVDHCVQALNAAFTLRDRAALMDLPLGIGIAVGPAVLGRGASDDNISVKGVATNLAARLQAAAGESEILLSADAYRRVRSWLAERGVPAEREELALKGFEEPQVAYRILAQRLELRT
jgi:adenylate cyclase